MAYGNGTTREDAHSRMGIASFVIAVVTTVAFVVLFVVSSILAASALGGADPQSIDPRSLQDNPAAIGLALVGFGILACVLLYLVGLALGIAGVIQRRRKRLFGVLGTAFNGLVLLVVVALTVFGLLVGAA